MTDISEFEIDCPKCGSRMRCDTGSDWQLDGMVSIDYRCPTCLHVERVWKREDREDRCSHSTRI